MSRDPQETNDRFRKSLDLPYLLVGDPAGQIAKDYRASWPIIGLSQRVTYVVGRDRRLRLAFHSEFDVAAHLTQVCQIAPDSLGA